ncbi:hypothetical protein K438DRAFT_1578409, partial [Mycena galopus ATCC 62051]
HHLLKGKFLEEKRNRRVDHLLHVLVNKAIPYFIGKHRRQDSGFEGSDPEVKHGNMAHTRTCPIGTSCVAAAITAADIVHPSPQIIEIRARNIHCAGFEFERRLNE